MDARQLELAQHALGWPRNYRNYFNCDRVGGDGDVWSEMERQGWAVSRPAPGYAGDTLFSLTESGIDEVKRLSR